MAKHGLRVERCVICAVLNCVRLNCLLKGRSAPASGLPGRGRGLVPRPGWLAVPASPVATS